MTPDDFGTSPPGRLVPTAQGCWAFLPDPLPPKLDLGPLAGAIARAAGVLGELSGLGRTLPNPYLLINPFLRREAVASSRIEGTMTSLSDLFYFEAGADERQMAPDAREVSNYVAALRHGVSRLGSLPVSLRLIRELHEVLLRNVRKHRGGRVEPGEFRRDQNWIGARLLTDARYVPPPVQEVLSCLDALERYINDPRDRDVPILIRAALVHYQFEAIHPFADGNGRVGRILVPLMLMAEGVLSQPLLYLSSFFERHRETYIDHLFEVSRAGQWDEWCRFFLRGVEEEGKDAISRARLLQDLRQDYHAKIQRARSSALVNMLVDKLFETPVMTIPFAAGQLGITYRAAQRNLVVLVEAGVLRSDSSKGRPRLFVADRIIEAIRGRADQSLPITDKQ